MGFLFFHYPDGCNINIVRFSDLSGGFLQSEKDLMSCDSKPEMASQRRNPNKANSYGQAKASLLPGSDLRHYVSRLPEPFIQLIQESVSGDY